MTATLACVRGAQDSLGLGVELVLSSFFAPNADLCETDGMKKSDVYYTAVYYEVRRARAALKKIGVPLRLSSYDGDR